MHDMRDLMKSLNHENESILNQSRSNFNLNRSILFHDPAYNQFGSFSNFKGMMPPLPNQSNSMLAFSQGQNNSQLYYPIPSLTTMPNGAGQFGGGIG